MRRSVLILLAILLAGVAIASGSYLLTRRVCVQCMGGDGDELAWLRTEFHLNDSELQKIRTLHEGYMPKCGEVCAKIAAKKAELDSTLAASHGEVTPTARQQIADIAALRAQCQANMLSHFYEVSQMMPPEQSQRYLTEMRSMTLGSHERIEATMAPAHHGHH